MLLQRALGTIGVLLVVLHVGRQGRSGVVSPVAHRALVWFRIVVRLQMYLKVIAAAEGGLTLRATVFTVPSVQLDVPVSATFVLEQPLAEVAFERHMFAVNLWKNRQLIEN